MDRLETMRLLVAALDEGSLAAAARRLGRSPAAATRAIAMLEQHVGARLLHRTTRSIRATDAGEPYAETCRQVIAALDTAGRMAAGEQSVARGLLTLTAPTVAGNLILRPALEAFLDLQPEVSARLLLLDRQVNLVEEGVDVALRIADLPDSSLVAVKVGEVRHVVCAAPAYLDHVPPIRGVADLAQHRAIALTQSRHGDRWHFPPAPGGSRPRTVTVPARLTVNRVEAALASAIAGHGIARLFSYQIADAVRAGQLLPLLEGAEAEPLPVHLLMPRAGLASAKLRAFLDFATPRLREEFKATDWR